MAELAEARPGPFSTHLELVEIALFIEDIFDVTLTDDDMTLKRLGSLEAIERLVLERLRLS
jgi:acyl carrier protein